MSEDQKVNWRHKVKTSFDTPEVIVCAGMPIDLVDKHGDPVHIGDLIRFDPVEWGGECLFIPFISKGEIVMPGVSSDLPEWCEILVKYDGTVVRA